MTQPPLGVNQSVVELKKRTPAWGGEEQQEAQEMKSDKCEFMKRKRRKKWSCLHFQTARINTLSDHR
jgi:hypothetical protein